MSLYDKVTQLLNKGGSYAINTERGFIQIDDARYGAAYRNYGVARAAITTRYGSISVADDSSGYAIALNSVSVARGRYAIANENDSVAISTGSCGLAIADYGRAITTRHHSIAIAGFLEMSGDFDIGILSGRFARVSGKHCTLIVMSVDSVSKLWLRKGTFVVLLSEDSDSVSKAVFTAGRELKPTKDGFYSHDDICRFFNKHKNKVKRNASNA